MSQEQLNSKNVVVCVCESEYGKQMFFEGKNGGEKGNERYREMNKT